MKKIKRNREKNLSEKDFETVIDASGCVVSPGLIDIHVHFRDPGFTRKEDIFTGAKSAAKVVLQLLYVWQIQNQ